MLRRSLTVLFVLVVVLVLAIPAIAHPPDDDGSSPGHSDGAPGQVVAELNCRATWVRTPLAGETGSSNDHKQGGSLDPGDTGVSNCDQWWNWAGAGSNGNHPNASGS
jgi:hypothetical protein